MTQFHRTALCAVVPTACAALALVLAPGLMWADGWNSLTGSSAARDAGTSATEARRLEADLAEAHLRRAVKQVLLDDLHAGRASLPDVTARFLEIGATDPDYMFVVRHDLPGRTDEECVARNVIACVLVHVEDAQKEAIGRRLDADLRAMLGGDAVARAGDPAPHPRRKSR